MKQYKHKQTDLIAKLDLSNQKYYNVKGNSIPYEIIENSNDWEEITKPENTCKINYETYHKNQHNFSTKEKAEEYIVRQKPCLSIAEILKCLKISINSDEKKSLDKLVKQKLKQ